MTRKRDDRSDVDDIVDKLNKFTDFVEENSEMVDRFFGAIVGPDDTFKAGGDSMMREFQVTEDEIIIMADLKDDSFDNVGITWDGDELHVEAGDNELLVEIEEDIVVEETETELKNGVLTLEIPIEETEEPDFNFDTEA